MNEDLKITKEDLVLWLDRPPSNDDLDLCSYLSNAVENQYKYYQENKQLKEDYNKVVHEATAFESKVYELEERINKVLDFINVWKKEKVFEISMIDLMQIEEWLKGDPNE